MPRDSTPAPRLGYPIGVVSRLTGIHPETLRIWERRYGLVQPLRGARRGRMYSEEDLRRLSLVKRLVDAGHAVSVVAALSTDALQACMEAAPAPPARQGEREAGPCRVIVVGAGLAVRFRQAAARYSDLDIVGVWQELTAQPQAGTPSPDVAVVDLPSVQPGTPTQVNKLLADSGAKAAVVVFGFGLAPLCASSKNQGCIACRRR